MFIKSIKRFTGLLCFVLLTANSAFAADEYTNALDNFSHATETSQYINSAYGYALFPSVGKAGFVVGGAYGKGRVYKQGTFIGVSKITQASIGFQFGAQEYSEIIFFKDKSTYEKFIKGNFELNAQASAIVVNLGASAQAGTTGNSAGAGQSGGAQTSVGSYVNGMSIYIIPKVGFMVEASVAGQSFTFEPK
ncbi:lipid-binding SYLF domain-containing protein [Shewanella sp. 202IG2-18]|nr:lipid-binding SYLF domain-containing protein [Parashewanella hymeniacidonis]MBM7071208.1 lipid-binding SYLF domain-containing protein [Parashewanella hymeniacidonis]